MLLYNTRICNVWFFPLLVLACGMTPNAVSSACHLTSVIATMHSGVYSSSTVNLTRWPANSGGLRATGTIKTNLSSPVYGHMAGVTDLRPRGSMTRSEMMSLLDHLPNDGEVGVNINLADAINTNTMLTNYASTNLHRLLRDGQAPIRWNYVTPLAASSAYYLHASANLNAPTNMTVNDPQLCLKLAEAYASNGSFLTSIWYENPNTTVSIRHPLNSTSDTFPYHWRFMFQYRFTQSLGLRALPKQLNFGANPAGNTVKRDVSIGLSSSIQSRVQYTFSYTSISKTREEVLIDGRRLPVQFAVSLPASNSNSFTDFKHQVSLTSPDPGKVDGNILVVAEIL